MNNLPPGVTEGMIPGNRREDQEKELDLCLTVGEVEALLDWDGSVDPAVFEVIESLVEQIREQYGDPRTCPMCKGEGSREVRCPKCGGSGEGRYDPFNAGAFAAVCPKCLGNGTVYELCKACDGEGRIV